MCVGGGGCAVCPSDLGQKGGPTHLILPCRLEPGQEGSALRGEKEFQHPAVGGAAQNEYRALVLKKKPIRKQVPADSPMRCIGWSPVASGGGPGLGGACLGVGGVAERASNQKAGVRHTAN